MEKTNIYLFAVCIFLIGFIISGDYSKVQTNKPIGSILIVLSVFIFWFGLLGLFYKISRGKL